jgi:hypothetical protein
MSAITLTLGQLQELIDLLGDDAHEQSVIVIDQCDGHSGPGLYAWDEEYPDEGAVRITGMDDAWDRNAERLTSEAGLGGGSINPNATSIEDIFLEGEEAP